MLTPEDRQALLDLARETVAATARGGDPPDLKNPSGALREKGAAFVTLRLRGELRGCIGHVEAGQPLWESVREMAQAAAVRDSRFSPVETREIAGLEIEISVLSPLTPIGADQIEVGVHGLYLKRGSQAGLLLPQVAVEWKWTAPEFLRHTYDKAGIPDGDAQAMLYAFRVERFKA